jgi:hypothetical protein
MVKALTSRLEGLRYEVWGFRIFGFSGFADLGFWGLGVLGFWDFGVLGLGSG